MRFIAPSVVSLKRHTRKTSQHQLGTWQYSNGSTVDTAPHRCEAAMAENTLTIYIVPCSTSVVVSVTTRSARAEDHVTATWPFWIIVFAGYFFSFQPFSGTNKLSWFITRLLSTHKHTIKLILHGSSCITGFITLEAWSRVWYPTRLRLVRYQTLAHASRVINPVINSDSCYRYNYYLKALYYYMV